jgi:ParB family protein of integrating conjugative element (PFGI_1 class)
MIAAGGNTRLAVIKDLLDETGDPRFRQVHCLFTPWHSESDVLAGHLVENELRADLMLIDKARALRELKALLDEENGAPITRSAFNRHLSSMGYRVSLRQLRRYDYAIEGLFPLIPIALRSGMGVRQIDDIRDVHEAYRTAHRGWGSSPFHKNNYKIRRGPSRTFSNGTGRVFR